MSITDLRCDLCGTMLAGPAAGVRFVYHPGVPALRDDTGLVCLRCWDAATGAMDTTAVARCAVCAAPAPRQRSLHLRRFDQPDPWRLCAEHAIAFLNSLATVQPKLDPATFRFPADGQGPGDSEGPGDGEGPGAEESGADEEAPGAGEEAPGAAG